MFTTPRSTGHLVTNAWCLGQFAIADISIGQGTPSRRHQAVSVALGEGFAESGRSKR